MRLSFMLPVTDHELEAVAERKQVLVMADPHPL
jgi:hypothetical protein